VVLHEVDLLFRGQSHVFRVPVTAPGFDPRVVVLADFLERYKARFDIELPEMTAMLVNLRTTVIGRRAPVDLATFAPAIGGSEAPRPSGARQVRFNDGWLDTLIFDRDSLGRGARLTGPRSSGSPIRRWSSTPAQPPSSTAWAIW
jgi:N-methylhydantoinase A